MGRPHRAFHAGARSGMPIPRSAGAPPSPRRRGQRGQRGPGIAYEARCESSAPEILKPGSPPLASTSLAAGLPPWLPSAYATASASLRTRPGPSPCNGHAEQGAVLAVLAVRARTLLHSGIPI